MINFTTQILNHKNSKFFKKKSSIHNTINNEALKLEKKNI